MIETIFYQKVNGKLWMSFKQADIIQGFFFVFLNGKQVGKTRQKKTEVEVMQTTLDTNAGN